MKKRKVKLQVNSIITINGKLTEHQINQIEEQVRGIIGHSECLSTNDGKVYELEFHANDMEIEIDSDIPIDCNCVIDDPNKFKLIKLREAQKLVESGNAAVDEKGHVVDAREHPDRPKIKY